MIKNHKIGTWEMKDIAVNRKNEKTVGQLEQNRQYGLHAANRI